ncbi:hypothetical protein CONPUDRAFT_92589 [Coniophora puteana RWD-64-598 SS2]|uniref:Uncharacterized protein n=1 Tax=Coniophora puteana (strain RWD-64-598) TaxID=741705 RepID=A0A5M3MBG2_CONPW|nr:uncharacterized protein CONPUDRAFT_92589 [Coniophora puteana RWD-64-598 SS2]EIW76578.1 hypothetical protein CONPUDRAFT_92589 [Coniophora puteana RWD-64-598 SS2]
MSYIHARRQIAHQRRAGNSSQLLSQLYRKWRKAQKKLQTGDVPGSARICSTIGMPPRAPSPSSSVQMATTGPLVRPSSPSAQLQAGPSSEIDDSDSLIRTANSDESADSSSGLLVTRPTYRLHSGAYATSSSSALGRHRTSVRRLWTHVSQPRYGDLTRS